VTILTPVPQPKFEDLDPSSVTAQADCRQPDTKQDDEVSRTPNRAYLQFISETFKWLIVPRLAARKSVRRLSAMLRQLGAYTYPAQRPIMMIRKQGEIYIWEYVVAAESLAHVAERSLPPAQV
jgi:hypothetical protein